MATSTASWPRHCPSASLARPSRSRMSTRAAALAALILLSLGGCRAKPSEPHFPNANRPVAPTVSDVFSTEDARDRLGEADEVIRLAGVKPGMWVADVGAGQGYYTVRLAPVVGAK